MKGKKYNNCIVDLKKYGGSSLSYLTVSNDLSVFRSNKWNGYFAYKEFFNSAIILGNPVIPKKSLNEAFDDLIKTFSKNKKHLSFFLCTEVISDILIKKGFKSYFFGKEAIIDLKKFNISGKKGWSIRSSVNYAKRNEMIVEEYKYSKKRNFDLEDKINKISEEWCYRKKNPELDFTSGHVNFEDYKNIRYFICKHKGKVVGFINLYPIFRTKSYYIDLTRHGNNSPRGTMDLLYYECIKKLKQEGIEKIYIGLSPLSFLNSFSKENNQNYIKILYLLQPFLGLIYPSKSEFYYKKKFATDWEPNYICFYPRISIRTIFSLIHSIYKGGFAGIFIHKIKSIFKK